MATHSIGSINVCREQYQYLGNTAQHGTSIDTYPKFAQFLVRVNTMHNDEFMLEQTIGPIALKIVDACTCIALTLAELADRWSLRERGPGAFARR